jgi:hypothetical protein
MTPGKELFYVSFASLCPSSLANLATVARIQIHLKRHHPDIWRSFGNPRIPFFAVMNEETHEASPAFNAFLRSKQRQALQDEALNRLILMKRRLRWVAGLAFVACGVLLVVVKP